MKNDIVADLVSSLSDSMQMQGELAARITLAFVI